MIYICIPAHNEEQTVGVVLWKIRQVMADFPRDYQLLVVDDASTDKTAEVLAPYARVLPLTVVRTESRQGEGAALEMMLREAVRRSQYPKRDVIVTLQADFTQEPDELISLIKRTEAGADIVVGEVPPDPKATRAVRWARALALRVLGRKRIPEGVSDPFTSYRAYRVFAVKKALEERGGRLVHWSGWAGAAELLLATAPHARRVDTVELVERRERLQRTSRMLPWPALKAVWSMAREAKPLVVATPAELDEAMRAVAAVRTSEVAAAREGQGGGRTQRGASRRGTTEEQARKTRARRDAREAAEGRTRNGDGRRERRPRQDRTEGAERRSRTEGAERRSRTEGAERRSREEAGEKRSRTERPEGAEKRLRRERAPRQKQSASAGAEAVEPQLPLEPLLDAAEPGAAGAAESVKKKRKRPRRRKKSTGANAAGSPDGELSLEGSAVEAAGEAEPAGSGSAEGGEGEAAEGAPRARRRRRGRRGGRRRNGSGSAAAEGASEASAEGGSDSSPGGERGNDAVAGADRAEGGAEPAVRSPEARIEVEPVPVFREGERNDA